MPWFQEATRRNPKATELYRDCSKCMRESPRATRRALACGWEEPLEGAETWEPKGYEGPPLTTCPGYTTKLPEVAETAEARFYLHNGSLKLLLHGELTDGLRAAIRELEAADGEATSWAIRNPPEKG